MGLYSHNLYYLLTNFNFCDKLFKVRFNITDCGFNSTSMYFGGYLEIVKNMASTLDQAFTSALLATGLRDGKISYDKKLGFDTEQAESFLKNKVGG